MEELQVIETTSGRQFKPWASREDVQAIEQAVEQAVQDPASVTAIASEIASGKAAIASAINAKGGSASATESFSELAQDIQDTPTSGVLSRGIVQSEPFSFLDYVCCQGAYPFTEIDDDSVTVINRGYAFINQTQLLKVRMTALTIISGENVFQSCSALQEVNMPNLSQIGGGYNFDGCSGLQKVEIPNLTIFNSSNVFRGCTSLRELKMPSVVRFGPGAELASINNLENLILGKITGDIWASTIQGSTSHLRNITIGQDTNVNLPFNYWNASMVIAEGQSGIDELNTNLYNNLLTKLYDHSNDGKTRTLRIGWLANVTAENIAYANAKGWTLTT